MSATVISGREDSEKLTTCESFEAIHNAFVCSQDETALVGIKEVLYSIRAEFDNVSSTVRVSDEIRLNTKVLVTICRIGPKNVDHKLLLRSRNFMNNF